MHRLTKKKRSKDVCLRAERLYAPEKIKIKYTIKFNLPAIGTPA
jgi:hypothetical protein